MAEVQDLATMLADRQALDRSMHVLSGLYIWEFFMTFDYEWALYRRRMPFKWTMLLYIGARWLTLVFVVCVFILFDRATEMDCDAVFKLLIATSYSALICTSAMSVLRAIAIWRFATAVVVATASIQLLDVAWGIIGITRARAAWDPEQRACVVKDTALQRDTMLVDLACQLSLLVIMFVGVLRMRAENGLWRVLYRQGILWLLLAVLALVPSNTLLILNLNDSMNLAHSMLKRQAQISQTPHLMIMVISTARIYRSLNEYCAPEHDLATVTTLDFCTMASMADGAQMQTLDLPGAHERRKSNLDRRPGGSPFASLSTVRSDEPPDVEAHGAAEPWRMRDVCVQVGAGEESFGVDFVDEWR